MANLDFSSVYDSLVFDDGLLNPNTLNKKNVVTSSTTETEGTSTTSSVNPTATKSDGCVSCPTVKCPDCGDNYYCVMTSLTCTKCPITYCVKKVGVISPSSSSADHKKNKGAIAGGVVGGVVGALLVAALIVYFFKRSKKRAEKERRLRGETGDENIFDDDDDDLFEFDDRYSKSGTNVFTTNGTTLRSSNLEKDDSVGILPLSEKVLGGPKRKNDETSSVSTGNASNVIPVGYIPGIKTSGLKGFRTGQKKKIPEELKSHYTLGSSILGDLGDDSDGETSNSKNLSQDGKNWENGSESDFAVLVTPARENHQTALRGKVSLVHIKEEEEEQEDEEEEAGKAAPEKKDDKESDNESIVLDIDIDHQT